MRANSRLKLILAGPAGRQVFETFTGAGETHVAILVFFDHVAFPSAGVVRIDFKSEFARRRK